MIISFKRSSLGPADPKPPIRRPTIHFHWSIHIISLEWFLVPILNIGMNNIEMLKTGYFPKKCIEKMYWIFSKLTIFKKWIFLLENWILFNGRHNDEKTNIFSKLAREVSTYFSQYDSCMVILTIVV